MTVARTRPERSLFTADDEVFFPLTRRQLCVDGLISPFRIQAYVDPRDRGYEINKNFSHWLAHDTLLCFSTPCIFWTPVQTSQRIRSSTSLTGKYAIAPGGLDMWLASQPAPRWALLIRFWFVDALPSTANLTLAIEPAGSLVLRVSEHGRTQARRPPVTGFRPR